MKQVFIVWLLVSVAVLVKAQERTPRVNTRQEIQQDRIQYGRAHGELTYRESTLLRKEQRHIRRVERRTKADGEVTRAERRELERKQDRASRHVHRANNNRAKPN